MNLLLSGFDKPVTEALCARGLVPKVWLQANVRHAADIERRSDIEIHFFPDYADCKFEPVFCRHVDRQVAQRVREKAYGYFARCFDRLIVRGRSAKGSWLSLSNYFEIALNFNWEMIVRNEIDYALFNNIPHGASEVVLYYLCKELGIKVACLFQPLIPGHLFITETIEDLGLFQTVQPREAGPRHVVKPRPPRPYYMKDRPRETRLRYLAAAGRAGLMVGLKWAPAQLGLGGKSYRKSLYKLKDARGHYRVHVEVEHSDYDLASRYVYFPLHLQPEMTTDILGGTYADQILAIEELARVLPDDVLIYVKENPAQRGVMREPNFFARLFAIDRVRYLPTHVDTLALIEKALCVATITGTAGFEAVQMGKPCIVFGYAWYRKLSGVFEWHEIDDIGSVLAFRPEPGAVQESLDRICRFLWPGIVDYSYSKLLQNFDMERNAATVAASVLQFMATRGLDIPGHGAAGGAVLR